MSEKEFNSNPYQKIEELEEKIQNIQRRIKEGWKKSLKQHSGNEKFDEGWNVAVKIFLEEIDKIFLEEIGGKLMK